MFKSKINLRFSRRSGHTAAINLVSAAFLILSAPLYAQTAIFPTSGVQTLTGITVVGHSEVKAKPDICMVSLTIDTTNRDEAEAVKENAASTQAVNDALAKSEIATTDIQIQSYSVSPSRDYTFSPPVLTGYTASTSLLVIIHNIAKAGVIADKVTGLGASVDGVTYDIADKSQIDGEQLAAAVANARSKADLIAGASGVEVGRVLAVTEQSASQPIVQPMIRMSAMAAAAPAPTTQFSPQQIEISADVTATYSIEYTKP